MVNWHRYDTSLELMSYGAENKESPIIPSINGRLDSTTSNLTFCVCNSVSVCDYIYVFIYKYGYRWLYRAVQSAFRSECTTGKISIKTRKKLISAVKMSMPKTIVIEKYLLCSSGNLSGTHRTETIKYDYNPKIIWTV